jgi:hypothetical protein
MPTKIHHGIYDTLLDQSLYEILAQNPEMRTVLGKIDIEEQPARYATFVARIIEQILLGETDPERRVALCNRIIDFLSGNPDMEYIKQHKLVGARKSLLLEITPPHYGASGIPRPQTPIVVSSLFNGSPMEPQLVHELLEEMRSADSVELRIISLIFRLVVQSNLIVSPGSMSWKT